MRLVDRIAYINHDIDDALRAGVLVDRRPAGARRSPCSGTTGSARIDTLVHDLVEHSERAGDIVQGAEVGGRDAAPAHVHVRARLPRADGARRARARSSACCAGCSTGTAQHPEELPAGVRRRRDRVIDYLAGMTDRFAIRAWTERFVPQGLRRLMARYTQDSRERVRDAVDFAELVGARTELRRAGRAAADRGCARSTTSARRRSASTRSRSSTTASAAARAATSSRS